MSAVVVICLPMGAALKGCSNPAAAKDYGTQPKEDGAPHVMLVWLDNLTGE